MADKKPWEVASEAVVEKKPWEVASELEVIEEEPSPAPTQNPQGYIEAIQGQQFTTEQPIISPLGPTGPQPSTSDAGIATGQTVTSSQGVAAPKIQEPPKDTIDKFAQFTEAWKASPVTEIPKAVGFAEGQKNIKAQEEYTKAQAEQEAGGRNLKVLTTAYEKGITDLQALNQNLEQQKQAVDGFRAQLDQMSPSDPQYAVFADQYNQQIEKLNAGIKSSEDLFNQAKKYDGNSFCK